MDDRPLKLLVDGMLGTLAKWLRLLGYDTAYDNAATDQQTRDIPILPDQVDKDSLSG